VEFAHVLLEGVAPGLALFARPPKVPIVHSLPRLALQTLHGMVRETHSFT
jgi:hypothetical protein